MGMRSDYLKEKEEQYRPQHEKKSGISNLKINTSTLKKILIVGGFVIAGTLAARPVFDKIADIDNARFEQEGERIREGVIELTGSTPEEIIERGMSR